MKLLVDRCAGHILAEWLRAQGYDAEEAADRGPDPGDRVLLEWAAAENRVLVTMDKDFGALLYVYGLPHAGLILLPHVPSVERIALLQQVLAVHATALEQKAVVTVRGGRIRVSFPPSGTA